MTSDSPISRLVARLLGRTIPSTSERALRRYLRERIDGPVDAFLAAAMDFYRDVPVAGIVGEEDDADMLVFQFGTYDWGEGPAFQLGVTRQFAHDDEGTLSQLHATTYYAPDAELERLGGDGEWCGRRGDVEAFARMVLASPAVAAVRTRSPLRREVRWEMV